MTQLSSLELRTHALAANLKCLAALENLDDNLATELLAALPLLATEALNIAQALADVRVSSGVADDE